jgi:hypothetical protein
MALHTDIAPRTHPDAAAESGALAAEDPLAPARGLLFGLVLGASVWAGGLWTLFHLK